MITEVKVPHLGDGIKSGDVLQILVREGDPIKKDQGIVELETDKATVEVPSSHAGVVKKIHVTVGQSVPVGAVLLTVDAAAAPAAAASPAKPKPQAVAKPQPPTEPARAPVSERPAAAKPAPAARQTAPPDVAPTPRPAPAVATPAASDAILAAGPAVRRFAREMGVDLKRVKGRGPGGRITREDVMEAVRQANLAVAAVPGAAPTQPAGPGEPSTDAWGPIRIERMSKIRKTIAAQMHRSWETCPRVTNFDDADVTELEHFRKSSKEDYAARGNKLTSMPFVIKAVAMALRAHPVLNASLDLENEQIIYKDYINIGVAVDTDRGLVVPALRGADRMSIPDIMRALATLAENVRNNKFTVDDLRGSTFSISNLGAIGGTYSTPIINWPEVAILLVGRSRKLPVVMDNDQIAVRLMMPLSLSYDHRLVDGGAASRLLNDIIGYLRAPSRLLLAP
jgi:pyruvate dehydrogenase E2 component (dihydrolipoamide acetyltransferase)